MYMGKKHVEGYTWSRESEFNIIYLSPDIKAGSIPKN